MKNTIFEILNADKDSRGWLSFEQFMSIVQHHPIYGYYGRGQVQIGKDGDFYTAPTLSPLFGETIAMFIEPILQNHRGNILELGAGQGDLAEQILSQWSNLYSDRRYYILELSPALTIRQQQRLAKFNQVVWIQQLPTAFVGAIIANEVFDSVPFRLYRKNKKQWFERGVRIEGEKLAWQDTIASDDTHQPLLKKKLADGYQTEISPQADALMHSLVDALKAGIIVIGDYGSDENNYYHPHRSMGTMRCYHQQTTDNDPLNNIGNKDITAHINFTAIANAGINAGSQLLGYMTQMQFLAQAGITERLSTLHDSTTQIRYWQQLAMVQKILSPTEMGETIKWMVFAKKIDTKKLDDFFSNDSRHHL